MAGTIVNNDALDAVNTAFVSSAQDILSNGVPGVWQQFTTKETKQGLSATMTVFDGVPRAREWVGSKEVHQLTKYDSQVPLRSWEATISIPVNEINQDPQGAVASRLAGFRSMIGSFYNEIMIDELLVNPTGYDGVSLLSASHPRLNGLAVQDNLTTSALTLAELENAKQFLRSVTDGKGKPLGCKLTHVLVGPAQETLAQQLTDSDQLVGISDIGEYVQPGGSGIDAAALMTNYIGGSAAVIVSEEITGNQWVAMDLSKGRSKPMYAAEFETPELTILNRKEDSNVFHDDEVLMSIVGRLSPMAMNWQTGYGSVSA
jgi:phage major head subunit gpT-like protein